MRDIIEVKGMIIKVMPIGEYDRRITILTQDRGKISAFARGARRSGNQLMGITRVFAFGIFRLYEGRDAYNLQSGEIQEYFDSVMAEVETTCYGTYFLELADYYAKEYLKEPGILKLLYVSLLALSKPRIPHRLTRRIFELKIMAINGEYEENAPKYAGADLAYTWHYIITSSIEKLYTFVIKEEVLLELERAVSELTERVIDKKMNSLEVLEKMVQ